MQLRTFYIISCPWTVKSCHPLARKTSATPLHSRRIWLFSTSCLNITPAKWTYGCGVYPPNQIFMRVGMIFKHCSPECTVASGSARRLACSATTSRCLSPLLPSVPSSRSMTSLLTSLCDSQPASGPDCCLELICLYELCFLFFFFFLFTASLTNGNVPPGSQAPQVDRRAYRTPLHCLSHLLSLGGNCVLASTSSMGFILENLCFALGLRVVFFLSEMGNGMHKRQQRSLPPLLVCTAPCSHLGSGPSRCSFFSVCLKIHVKLIAFFFSTQRVRTAHSPRLGSQLPVSLCFPRECIYSGLWFHGLYGFYYSIMYLQSSAPGHKSPLPCLPKIESPMLSNLPYNSWSVRFFLYFMNAFGTESHPAGTSHFTLFTFFPLHFSRAVISHLCPNDLRYIYSLFPVALEERGFFFAYVPPSVGAGIVRDLRPVIPGPRLALGSSPLHVLAIVFLLSRPVILTPGWLDY